MQGNNKTWKREVAFLLLCWIVYLSLFGTLAVFEVAIWPVFFFAAGAFGLDEYSKNIQGNTALFMRNKSNVDYHK